MLLVIYNSNSHTEEDKPTIRGWSLYTTEDWSILCTTVSNYFFYLPDGDAELCNGLCYYYSYEEWLADYQVSEIDSDFAQRLSLKYKDKDFIDVLLGTDFYVPDIATQPDDEPMNPEMDAYA